MHTNISRSSTKKGPGRMHHEPVSEKLVRSDKRNMPRFCTGAKNARKAIAKLLTKRGTH